MHEKLMCSLFASIICLGVTGFPVYAQEITNIEDNNVILVVVGINKPSKDIVKIGSLADSVNNIVVNAVTKSGLSIKYIRKRLILLFFLQRPI